MAMSQFQQNMSMMTGEIKQQRFMPMELRKRMIITVEI